jgi:thymidylate synthase (FAD)
MRALNQAESSYFEMIDDGCTPQQARDVLPNATKTELIMTGFAIDWRHVFDLRLFEKTGKVAPDMLDLMQKAQKTMQEAGIWDDIMSKHSKFE